MRKICVKCKQEKNIENFYVDRSRKATPDGRRGSCIECEKARNRKYRESRNWSQYVMEIRNRKKEVKEKYLDYNREYGRKNRKTLTQKDKKRQQDPQYKTRQKLRKRCNGAIIKNQKFSKYEMYISASISETRQWLEAQFYPHPETGEMMSWENRDKEDGWIIDHILPLRYFDSLKEKDNKRGYHWFNLQPLWKCDNPLKIIEENKWLSLQ